MRRLKWHQAGKIVFHVAREVLVGGQPPLVATLVLTDRCNLSCLHCAVGNVELVMYPYDDMVSEMHRLYAEGIRVLILMGGETTLWREGERTLDDVIAAAWATGFYHVSVVTNGTQTLAMPNTSLVLLSLDGLRASHDRIRGDGVFDTVMSNLDSAGDTNISLYPAINNINKGDIEGLCRLAADHPRLRGISFNMHTPYPGTELLSLSPQQKAEVVGEILRLKREGAPVFNLDTALHKYLDGNWARPCRHCIISEGGVRWDCGRCVEIPGLCEQCGYLFAVELGLLFSGSFGASWDALRTYMKYV